VLRKAKANRFATGEFMADHRSYLAALQHCLLAGWIRDELSRCTSREGLLTSAADLIQCLTQIDTAHGGLSDTEMQRQAATIHTLLEILGETEPSAAGDRQIATSKKRQQMEADGTNPDEDLELAALMFDLANYVWQSIRGL
jgi:hypothetical protein